ncbi:MAG: MerR family DNA-binding transcriptional regulator [Deltaproteobacteria bacterium]|nr:MerR family DNA-binding transcriptional regulator [Deltaproteobacteria bacterium]
MSHGDGPFRIAMVAELTGVAEATLRAWERRYGIPSPQRTASGYRLYGMDQVQEVQEMKRLCESGMAAADAAARVKSRTGAREASGEVVFADDSTDVVVASLLDAVSRFDDLALDEGLRRVMFLGNPVHIFDNVIVPLLVEVGERWHAGKLSVAQEHFATQKVSALVRDLLRLSTTVKAPCAVLGSFADEPHEIGTLGFGLRLASWAVRPIVLGARTPPSAIRSAVQAVSPKLVALSVTNPLAAQRAKELCEDYAAACGDVPWIVGGAGASHIQDIVTGNGGVVAPRDVQALEAEVRALLAETPAALRKRKGAK